jgi:hypothetical protein
MRNNDGNALRVQEKLARSYDNIEFSQATGVTNYDVKAGEATAFINQPVYTTINIRSDKAITVRINSTSYPAITIEANKPFELDDLVEITNIYTTNASGASAAIKIFGVRKGDQ